MSKNKVKNVDAVEVDEMEVNSLKGTLFSTLVFVGGGIIIFILVLFFVFMMRV